MKTSLLKLKASFAKKHPFQNNSGDMASAGVIARLLNLAAIGLTLALPGGKRQLLRELRKYIVERPTKPMRSRIYLSQALYYMKERKLLRLREHKGVIMLELTERGRQRWLRYNFTALKIKPPVRWDEKWRLLLFDIPDKRKMARDALRYKLKQLGFLQFQESVWIFPYPCQNEIDFLAEVFSIGPYLNLLTVKIENDKPLRARFKL